MIEAQLFFLSDQYYIDFPDDKLMKNKDVIAGIPHNRPCFFAFRDLKKPEILWLVPISSKCKKYKIIEQEKIRKYGSCLTIRFGRVLERDAVFLIQNMCPTTEKYLIPYIDKNNNPIRIDSRIANDVVKSAKNVLAMANRGSKVIFPDVFKIFRSLESQLDKESQRSNPDCNQNKPSVLDELKQI
ncbi:MAG: hypothetical protein J5494_01050, partial [Candidatus Methanomethylophilaceae archaeon]|nr:hypothetical protein [Candidatus Methanomethylophilaceae archaeon]